MIDCMQMLGGPEGISKLLKDAADEADKFRQETRDDWAKMDAWFDERAKAARSKAMN